MATVTLLTKQLVDVPAQVAVVTFSIPAAKRVVGVDVINLDGTSPQLGVAGRQQTGVNVIQDLIGADNDVGQHRLEVQLAEDVEVTGGGGTGDVTQAQLAAVQAQAAACCEANSDLIAVVQQSVTTARAEATACCATNAADIDALQSAIGVSPTSVAYTSTFVVETTGPIASCSCTCSSGLKPSPVQVGEVVRIFTVDGNTVDAEVVKTSRVGNTWTTTLGVAATTVSLIKSNIKCFGCY